ncbi:hypothetical protein [Nocardia aurantiaca]|uniref:Uncharacterized protein n=1 Tax=Nocardia aurantiaca TaxID=2675850 RepID=A0A6I3LAB7_9NOCA|nr:hypothetical protein [Nocardia aurantiaca]MTE16789.1 hypothetical protein [Nocardia aurantiaca]
MTGTVPALILILAPVDMIAGMSQGAASAIRFPAARLVQRIARVVRERAQ